MLECDIPRRVKQELVQPRLMKTSVVMLPSYRSLLLALAVLYSIYGLVSLMAVNSICRDGPVAWRCKSVDTCSTLDKDDTVQICGFNGKPLVCCPPETFSSSIPRRPDNSDRFNNSSSRNK